MSVQFSTAQYVPATDTGYARLARLPKWGNGNTSGTALAAGVSMSLRLMLMSANGFNLGACTVTVKVFTDGNGSPRCLLTTDNPAAAGIEVYAEDNANYWYIIARHNSSGDAINISVIYPDDVGFALFYPNEPLQYAPTGLLVKPTSNSVRTYTSNGSTAGAYVKVATITTTTAYCRYHALLAIANAEGSGSGSAWGLYSLEINQGALSAQAAVALRELTLTNGQDITLYYVPTFTSGTSTQVDIYIKAANAYSAPVLTVLSDTVQFVTAPPYAVFPVAAAWTASITGGVRAQSAPQLYALTYSNGWAAAAGYTDARSSGLQVIGRMAYLNMTVTGGTTTNNTVIATVNFAPPRPIDVPALVTDAMGTSSVGRITIYDTGQITIRGSLLSSNLVSMQASYPIGGFTF